MILILIIHSILHFLAQYISYGGEKIVIVRFESLDRHTKQVGSLYALQGSSTV